MIYQDLIEVRIANWIEDVLPVKASQESLHNMLDAGFGEQGGSRGIHNICEDLKNLFEEYPHPVDEPQSATQPSQDGAQMQRQLETPFSVNEAGVKTIVHYMAHMKNHLKAQLIGLILHYLATNKIVSSKAVCFALLKHNLLTPENATYWNGAFKLMKAIIPGVNYKGVREIMKICLEISRLLPVYLRHSQLEQADSLCSLIQYIFDRNQSLLPGYFIVNELLKMYPDHKTYPHWQLSGMFNSFIYKCKKVAQMLTITGRHKLRPVVERSGHSIPSMISWKLDSKTLKFHLKGALPYCESIQGCQTGLLMYVFRQPFSKHMIFSMLDAQIKQHYHVFEEKMVEFFVESLEKCTAYDVKYFPNLASNSEQNREIPNINEECATPSGTAFTLQDSPPQCQCSHVIFLLIYFCLNRNILFKSFVEALHHKLRSNSKFPSGRDHLMWVLLQFLSGNMGSNSISDFQAVIRLIELLYPEREPLPVPDCSVPHCSLQLSAMCIIINVLQKAETDNLKTHQNIPTAFTGHQKLLQSLVHNPQDSSFILSTQDYRISLLLNAYSANQQVFQRSLKTLTGIIFGDPFSTIPMPGSNCVALDSTTPLSMSFLDSLIIHVKRIILQTIFRYITKHSNSKFIKALSPALVETYARLLCSETEGFCIRKELINQILPQAIKLQTWNILHALLEMFTYRIHHSPPRYKIQILSIIHHLTTIPLSIVFNMNQLHLCMESSAIRLITSLGNTDVISCLPRLFSTEWKPDVISSESEELNRVIVLTMARAINVSGCNFSGESARWCVNFLKAVMTHTPHTWETDTLQRFPRIIANFYRQHGTLRDTRNLKNAVEEEYQKWNSISNENDKIAHFSQHNTHNLFLCILFKIVLDTKTVPPEAYKVLNQLGPRQLMANVRTLSDFLVPELTNCRQSQNFSKHADTMYAIIWQFNIVPIDRLILCLSLRTPTGNGEAQICFIIMQIMLLGKTDFRDRVQYFVRENSPEHWKETNWYEKHMTFHRKFPEKFVPVNFKVEDGSPSSQHQTLPIYFSNVCLRFLPVLDIIVQRFMEVPEVHKRLRMILERLGSLYKFHDRPITYLYNTLHQYEERLRVSPLLKRQLVESVVMSQKDVRPTGWALTEEFITYLGQPSVKVDWNSSLLYYVAVVKRLVQTLQGKSVFPEIEWRFNEFANCGEHALHVTCVELMAIPLPPSDVATNLMDTLLRNYFEIPKEELMDWVNAIGLILAWLPEAYLTVVYDKIVALLQIPQLATPTKDTIDPFNLLNFSLMLNTMGHCGPSMTLALVHSFWNHASFGQVGKIPQLMKKCIRPILKTEEQYIALCHIVAPFLQRLHSEGGKKLFEVPLELYKALAIVDKYATELKYEDAICDLLYHIKYMFTGDSIKNDIEDLIKGLRPSMKLRLRFITHLKIESTTNTSSTTTTTTSSTSSTETPSTSTTSSTETPSTSTTTCSTDTQQCSSTTNSNEVSSATVGTKLLNQMKDPGSTTNSNVSQTYATPPGFFNLLEF